MKLNLHNELRIKIADKEFKFFNTIFSNIYQKIANFDTFFDKIAIGNGFCENFSNNYHLDKFLYLDNFQEVSSQLDPSNNVIYIKKTLTVDPKNILSTHITEIGITSNDCDENNPEIYNYFSFISNELPNGIDISSGDEIIISVTIYLTINSTSVGLLTKGDNPFLNLLLGGGSNTKEIFVARGNDLSNNEFINRTNDYLSEKYPCEISYNVLDNVLNLQFSGDLKTGETNEIVFILDDVIFARVNTKLLNQEYYLTEDFTSKGNYIIDLGTDVSNIQSVYDTIYEKYETDYFVVKYANNFSSKTFLPFNNLFNVNTPRFLSLDGDKLFFILNDIVYLYKNVNYNIEFVFAINLQIQNILKITAFDDFVFVFTQSSPCVYAYKIKENTLVQCNIDLSEFEYLSTLVNFTLIDIVQGKNGTFMLGYVIPNDTMTDAYTLYLTFDEISNSFIFDTYLKTSNYTFTYLLPFHKNNFCDAQIIYLQAGEISSKCRRAIHTIDKTSSDGYNITAYYYTYATTHLCIKSRAVVVEKNATPNLWIYYYPQVYRFNLAQLTEASKSYISTNLLYLIQKLTDGTFRAYNLVGYNTPELFSNGLPKDLDQSKILHVEFLIDTVLFFMDDENEPIIAYNLNIVGTCLENIKYKNQNYTISYSKKETLGSNTKGVNAKFLAKVNVWFSLINLTKYLLAKTLLYSQHQIIILNYIFSIKTLKRKI